ncbi:MAG: hypothetical protein HYZ61_03600 [Candidatus Andersenbacteria bacterium]|nr:hypothetical protein [Candidatus Andersenbacteria bacterium]
MRTVIAKFIPRGSIILAVTTFGSYAAGLLRDRILSQKFGASVITDAYNAAFLPSDFLFNLLVASGIAAAGVPLFISIYKNNKTKAHDYMNALLVTATATMIVVGVAIFLFASSLSHLVAPGLSEEGRQTTIQLMRILAFSPILFAASNALGAFLVAQKRFLWYGLSPMMYNVGIIGGVLLLTPRMGIIGAAWGALIGAGLHLLVRVVDASLSGWKLRFAYDWPKAEMKKTFQLMAPKMIGHPVEMVTFWIFTSLASLLEPGSITALNLARNFQSVPVSLIGIAIATAVFPSLAHAAVSSRKELHHLFQRTAGTILLISGTAALIIFVSRRLLISVLLGGGEFDEIAIAKTALLLGVFCLSIPTESVSHLLARTFYAAQNTIIPVVFSVINLIVAGSSAYILTQEIGIAGLPLGFFLGSFVKSAGLYIVLLRKRDNVSQQG